MSTVPRVARLGRLVRSRCPKQTLQSGASVYLNFIALTESLAATREKNTKPKQSAVALKAAAERYVHFRRLQERGTVKTTLVPTRDISFFWAADMLRPGSYDYGLEERLSLNDTSYVDWYFHQQCRLLQSGAGFEAETSTERCIAHGLKHGVGYGLFAGLVTKQPLIAAAGVILGTAFNLEKTVTGAKVTPAIARYDRDGSGLITAEERVESLRPWIQAYDATEEAWVKETGRRYRMKGKYGSSWLQNQAGTLKLQPGDSDRIDSLLQAVNSQSTFHKRILKLGPGVIDESWIARAVDRYFAFLELAKENAARPKGEQQLLVPTLDIDLVWHVHQLSPLDYRDDCVALMGRVFMHDTGQPVDELKGGFESTKRQWQDKYGSAYIEARNAAPPSTSTSKPSWFYGRYNTPATKKQVPVSGGGYAGCGSCGFGDAAFHSNMQHQHVETVQVQEAAVSDSTSSWAHGDVTSENFNEQGSGFDAVWAEPGAGDFGGADSGASCGGGCGGD